MVAANARARIELPSKVSAPLFQSLIGSLDEEQRRIILDFGTARPQTLSLLDGFRVRLDIANLVEEIEGLNGLDDPEVLAERADAALSVCDDEPLDIVLAWDFLNYLDRKALSALMSRVAGRCRPGARIHALIVYSERTMQPKPGQFAPIDAGHLQNLSAVKRNRDAPRYSAEDLTRSMPGSRVERVMLLSNGMQEYVLKLGGDDAHEDDALGDDASGNDAPGGDAPGDEEG